jgi:hypothetical protein
MQKRVRTTMFLLFLYNLKQLIRQIEVKKFKLIDFNGQEYLSESPGTLGGNKKLKISKTTFFSFPSVLVFVAMF